MYNFWWLSQYMSCTFLLFLSAKMLQYFIIISCDYHFSHQCWLPLPLYDCSEKVKEDGQCICQVGGLITYKYLLQIPTSRLKSWRMFCVMCVETNCMSGISSLPYYFSSKRKAPTSCFHLYYFGKISVFMWNLVDTKIVISGKSSCIDIYLERASYFI